MILPGQVYFILSNNRVNELIQHDFDFTDIDYISYYISFVKALSLKLNNVRQLLCCAVVGVQSFVASCATCLLRSVCLYVEMLHCIGLS